MRFIEDTGSSFARERVEIDKTKRPNYFMWAIIILFLICLNIGSWGFCNIVFGRPEMAFSYNLLTKLDKLEPIEGFTSTTAPGGQFFSAKQFNEDRIHSFSPNQLEAYNGFSTRKYLWNYNDKDRIPDFIHGDFTVKNCRPLTSTDLFPSGLLVRGSAYRYPDVEIDFVVPTSNPLSEDVEYYKPGDTISIGRSTHSAAVLHVTRTSPDEPAVLLAVPLITKTSGGKSLDFKTAAGETLALRTPTRLNIQ